jgi:divinyl protochlorophyllide a 8-vinyl-reductase
MDSGSFAVDTGARIGPNAILQLLPVLDDFLGRAGRDRLLLGIDLPPPEAGMWPESACRAAHLAVWQGCGDQAGVILSRAGQGTADYILAHRIPDPAKALIRSLPAALGARLLTAAIARHAWTFTGSGRFRVTSRRPLTIEVADNPLACPGHLCQWHAAVFTGLYRTLVWPRVHVDMAEDSGVSRFLIHPRQQPHAEVTADPPSLVASMTSLHAEVEP